MFVCKQKTAYELRISDWSSDVCASDLHLGLRRRSRHRARPDLRQAGGLVRQRVGLFEQVPGDGAGGCEVGAPFRDCMRKPRECGAFSVLWRSEEHTSELQSLMRISYAVFCLKKKNNTIHHIEKMTRQYKHT